MAIAGKIVAEIARGNARQQRKSTDASGRGTNGWPGHVQQVDRIDSFRRGIPEIRRIGRLAGHPLGSRQTDQRGEIVPLVRPCLMSWIAIVALIFVCSRAVAELLLAGLKRRHVLANANDVPDAFAGIIDDATYRKSVDYTLARNKLGQIETIYDSLILLIALFSGVLPWLFSQFHAHLGERAWAMAAFLFTTGVLLSLPGLPFAWYAQFRLEERFGFNTTTQKLWWADRVKGLLLAILLGYPILVLLLKIVDWAGANWWLWGWAAVMGFQLIMVVLAP